MKIERFDPEVGQVEPLSPENPFPPARSDWGRNQGVRGWAEPVGLEAAKAAKYQPAQVGETWGPAWGSTWFHLEVDYPEDLSEGQAELFVDLGWAPHSPGFQCEALAYLPDGTLLKALNPKSRWLPVPAGPKGTHLEVYVEAAANPLLLDVHPFLPTEDGDKQTASQREIYTFRAADLVKVNHEVRALALDLQALVGITQCLEPDESRGWELLLTAGRALDELDLADVPATAAKAREVLRPALSLPARPDAHEIYAVGHAHIDSAWLWPIRETRRKVVRTLANQVRLLDDGKDLIFALPAAQHVAWLKADDPKLFERVKHWVKAGRIVPVGGMWVEPDAVLPGSEALARQLVEGLDYFEEELGATCQEVWLPDSFGYSAAIPQVAKLAGMKWFLTQKISWNQVDKFPHHTLWWEGIDGTRLFTHFPSADTYGSDISGPQLAHAVRNFKEKGQANASLLPFGYGDGGGGPTREMLELIERNHDVAGAPKVRMATPTEFFTRAQEEYPQAPTWTGELYLELHRGTFTTQANTKGLNRRVESALRQAEAAATLALVEAGEPYPHEEFERIWHTLLLCQFHDILPGTSVAWVYRDVEQWLTEAVSTCAQIQLRSRKALGLPIPAALEELALTPSFITVKGVETENSDEAAQNTRVIKLNENAKVELIDQPANLAEIWEADGQGVEEASSALSFAPSTKETGGWELTNGLVKVRVDNRGCLTSIYDLKANREALIAGAPAGELWWYQDFPNMWDAWDLDPFYRQSQEQIGSRQVDEPRWHQGNIQVPWSATFGNSTVKGLWTLRADQKAVDLSLDIDWHEEEKLLKCSFPVNVHTDHAQFETQFGYVTRPTHQNTSWDAYRFEVNAHRWLRVADANWGVSILNSANYGWSIDRVPADGGGTYQRVMASLLRAPKFPDPRADIGRHRLHFSFLVGVEVEETVAAAERFNETLPTLEIGSAGVDSLLTVEGAHLESLRILPARASIGARAGWVAARIYESTGAQREVELRAPKLGKPEVTDLRYRDPGRDGASIPVPELLTVESDGRYRLTLRPFQVLTLCFPVREEGERDG
ncbi:alpha-mannosidase [Boudabousia liubingyangii]|nr:glycoside hydrolase family 38 C-terminal domain-containing protein [Boudabousia liubingyangii]